MATGGLDLIVRQLSAVITDLSECSDADGDMSEYDAQRLATRARASISRYAPPGTSYAQDAAGIDATEWAGEKWKAHQLTAIVHALRDDYDLGGLIGVQELVHADLFDDFLDMSVELLEKGYVGPAAALAGSVLEEHLRKLAAKHQVSAVDGKGRPKSMEVLGVDLRKANAMTEVQRKSVTAWYAQRNEGAHGHSGNLADADVERMIDGIRDFVARYPA